MRCSPATGCSRSTCSGTELDLEVYTETLRVNVGEATSTRGSWTPGSTSGRSCEACLEEFRIADYDIVGFTTTFEQNLASLALARLIKERWPDKAIVFGGGNCEGEMGRELHRSFPWIDFVCSGEGERSFPQLVDAIAAGATARASRASSTGGTAAPPTTAAARRSPTWMPFRAPNYDEYFAAVSAARWCRRCIRRCSSRHRGAAGGARRSHCTFCGLNGATMTFRSKSAERVLGELEGFRRALSGDAT